MTNPLVSFLLVNYHTPDMTAACLRSIKEHTKVPHEVVVVDNSAADDPAGFARLIDGCQGAIVAPAAGNRGFGAGCNAAAALASGKYYYLLNTDTLLHEDSAAKLADLLEKTPDAIAVGSRLHNPDGGFQPSAGYFPTLLSLLAGREVATALVYRHFPRLARHIMAYPPPAMLARPQLVDWCVGASLMVRAEAYRSVGGFDEDYFMYAEEMDLCYRLSRLGQIWFTPETSVLHFDAGSHGGPADENRIARIAAGQRLFFRKHYPPARAQLYEEAWLGASCIKYMLWRVAAMLTGNQGYRAKARWHRIFVQRYRALEYPLHPTV